MASIEYKHITNIKDINDIDTHIFYKSKLDENDMYKVFDKDYNSLTHLEFDSEFNQYINIFPSNIIVLKFGMQFNQHINELPHNLKELIFNDTSDFNQYLPELPISLKHLKLGNCFNKKISKLPNKLVKLIINNHKYNHELKLPKSIKVLIIPKCDNTNLIKCKKLKCDNNIENISDNLINLKHLEFTDKFNEPISKFPPNLVKLKFSYNFNNKISNLPQTLKLLDLGNSSEQHINNLCSKNIPLLKVLIITFNKKHKIDNLPNSIKKLLLYNFNNKLNCLPNKISYLINDTQREYYNIHFNNNNNNVYYNNLPNSIEFILINNNSKINNLPHKIKYIFGKCKIKSNNLPFALKSYLVINTNHNNTYNNLPQNIKSFSYLSQNKNDIKLNNLPLHLSTILFANNSSNINNLPHNLKHVILELNTLKSIKLPNSITELNIRIYDTSDKCIVMPINLNKLCYICNYDINYLPQTLKEIETNNNKIMEKLPQGLEKLTLYDSNNIKSLNLDFIPESVNELTLNELFDNKINDLPSNIKKINIYDKQYSLVNNIYKNHVKFINTNYYFDHLNKNVANNFMPKCIRKILNKK